MTYVAVKRLQRSKRVFLHPDLTNIEKNIQIPCQPLQRFQGCLGRAEDQHLIHLDRSEFFLSPKLTDVHDFDEIRLENHVQLAVNESQPVVDCVRAVDEALSLKPDERRRRISTYLQEDDMRLFQHDKAIFTQPHYHRLNQHETGKQDGTSFLLEGTRDDLGVLVVHGFSASPAEVRPLAEALHGEGFTVFAPRLRGHGTSPYDLATRTWADWLASARLGYTLLRNRCRRVAIVGHSMGGCLSFLLATEVPAAGVVSISAPTRLASRRSSLVPLLHKANRLANLLTGLEGLKNFDRAEPENPDINYRHLPISGVRELQDLISAFQEVLPEVKVPVLVLQADEDPTVELASAHDIEERLGSHSKRVVIIPAERHVLVLDDRLGVHRRVRKFMVGLADGTIGND
jgi:esterase/lipase